ncbi:MAG TPA: SseB family protein, partial [Naasia sp.]
REQAWVPAHRDLDVRDAVRSGVADESDVRDMDLRDGDPGARLRGPELLVLLALRPGLDAGAVAALVGRVQERWAALPALGRVESLAVKLVPAPH